MTYAPLLPEELVDDRTIRSLEQDKFGHTDFIDELASIVETTHTPSNVALFGSWGSGKSSVGELLKERFEGHDKVRFVQFHALKYGQAPLRRHFVSQIASELKIKDRKYHAGIYEDTVGNSLEWSPKKLLPFLQLTGLLFVAVMIGVALFATAYAGIVSLVDSSNYLDQLGAALQSFVTASFLPVAVLAASASLVGQQFKIEQRTVAPQSDEQFEDLFQDLVHDALSSCALPLNCKSVDDTKRRLVVFIDELDRCSPLEVASTLETLRTFLEVKGCLFIVAADQQALEEALTKKVKQATPANTVSPYYSAGSAYMDKIFQLQLALPAFKPQRLTSFAVGLVRTKPGVWERLRQDADLEEVISVLVPSHVSGPRRVKTLLNHFALLYRVVEKRVDEHKISGPASARAAEVAKLACLRMEFPIFAADLNLDHRLPEWVLALENAEDGAEPIPDHVSDDLKARAELWADRKLLPDQLLADDGVPDDSDAAGESEEARALRVSFATQLLRYLQKTSHVAGPQRDLIFLESAAVDLPGLDAADADTLEQAAVDGLLGEAKRIVGDLSQEGRSSAIKLLARLIHQTAKGVEGDNAIRVMLRLLPDLVLSEGDATEVARAVAPHGHKLETDDLLGAFQLSLIAKRHGGELRREVLQHDDVLSIAGMDREIVRHAAEVLDDAADSFGHARVGEAFAQLAVHDPDGALDELFELDEERAEVVVASWPRAIQPTEGREAVVETSEGNLSDLLDVLFTRIQGSEHAVLPWVGRLVEVALHFDQGEITDRILNAEGVLGLAYTTPVADALARIVDQRVLSFPRLLRHLDEQASDDARDAVSQIAVRASTHVWDQLLAHQISNQQVSEFAAGLREAMGRSLEPSEALLDHVRATMPMDHSPAGADRWNEIAAAADEFEPLGLMTESALADVALQAPTHGVARPGQPHDDNPELGKRYLQTVERYAASATSDVVRQLIDASRNAGTWDGFSQAVCLTAASLGGLPCPYSAEELAGLTQEPTTRSALPSALGHWLDAYRVKGPTAWSVLGVYITAGKVPSNLQPALSRRIDDWRTDGGEEHRQFLSAAVQDPSEPQLGADFVSVSRANAEADFVIDELLDYAAQDRTTKRARRVLRLWKEMSFNTRRQSRFVKEFALPLAQTRTTEALDVLTASLVPLKRLSDANRRTLRTAMEATATEIHAEKSLRSQLEDAGWVKKPKKKGFLGL